MAKVFGESGRFVSSQAVANYWKQLLTFYIGIGVVCLISGISLGHLWTSRPQPWLDSIVLFFCLILFLRVSYRFVIRKADAFEQNRLSFMKGAIGEAIVASRLANFPDNYFVIHDLSTPFGNLDHVVVGPSGIFVIETKNLKGIISADGHGGLLINGQPPEKQHAQVLLGRILDIRKKVEVLCDHELPFIHGLLVFPSARVEASWGATGSVDCIRDEKLWDYIVESKRGKRLNRRQTESIAKALLALATMDKQFSSAPPSPGN